MARVRKDNDKRYVLRESLIDGSTGKPILGDTIIINRDKNVDGGRPDSVYLADQIVSGGTPSG